MTSRRRSHEPLETNRALLLLRRFRSGSMPVLGPNHTTFERSIDLLRAQPCTGKDVFDRYLAATALSNGITTIVTENLKDFTGIPGLTAINPFA